MRASLVGALLLVWVAGALGCADAHSLCGSGGTFVADGDTEHCVYSLALPIVIEGGFECPSAMPFELDLNAHRVCSGRAIDRQAMPPALCAKMPELCSASEAPHALPQPVMWNACDPRTLDEGKTGDRCGPMVMGCGTSGGCSTTAAICDPEGTLKVSELEILECAEGEAVVDENTRVFRGAEDCEAALAEGHSFQACEGPFVCARRTEEACCVEYALCNADGPLPTGSLMRYQFCERGCTNVEPDERLETVTDCSAFNDELADEFSRADLPCEGDFVCWGDHDLSNGRGANVPLTSLLRWCSEGVVHGQHSTISPVFIPVGPQSR